MGTNVSRGQNNDELVDNLVKLKYLTTEEVIAVFRSVDRGDYVTAEARHIAYTDSAWRNDHIHLSAPCIYSYVMETLQIEKGMSFLNIGSGTGYLSTLIGLLIGEYGINHGIELRKETVDHAEICLDAFITQKLPLLKNASFCKPVFSVGNALTTLPNMKYDRIYCGARCNMNMVEFFKKYLKMDGCLILPIGNRLCTIERTTSTVYNHMAVTRVAFSSLVMPKAPYLEQKQSQELLGQPLSLFDLTRARIRDILQEKIFESDPELAKILKSDDQIRQASTKPECILQRLQSFDLSNLMDVNTSSSDDSSDEHDIIDLEHAGDVYRNPVLVVADENNGPQHNHQDGGLDNEALENCAACEHNRMTIRTLVRNVMNPVVRVRDINSHLHQREQELNNPEELDELEAYCNNSESSDDGEDTDSSIVREIIHAEIANNRAKVKGEKIKKNTGEGSGSKIDEENSDIEKEELQKDLGECSNKINEENKKISEEVNNIQPNNIQECHKSTENNAGQKQNDIEKNTEDGNLVQGKNNLVENILEPNNGDINVSPQENVAKSSSSANVSSSDTNQASNNSARAPTAQELRDERLANLRQLRNERRENVRSERYLAPIIGHNNARRSLRENNNILRRIGRRLNSQLRTGLELINMIDGNNENDQYGLNSRMQILSQRTDRIFRRTRRLTEVADNLTQNLGNTRNPDANVNSDTSGQAASSSSSHEPHTDNSDNNKDEKNIFGKKTFNHEQGQSSTSSQANGILENLTVRGYEPEMQDSSNSSHEGAERLPKRSSDDELNGRAKRLMLTNENGNGSQHRAPTCTVTSADSDMDLGIASSDDDDEDNFHGIVSHESSLEVSSLSHMSSSDSDSESTSSLMSIDFAFSANKPTKTNPWQDLSKKRASIDAIAKFRDIFNEIVDSLPLPASMKRVIRIEEICRNKDD